MLIKITEEDHRIAFYVSNNGKALDNEVITYGTSIHIVIAHLSTFFKEDFEFEMMNNDDDKVMTKLTIPELVIYFVAL